MIIGAILAGGQGTRMGNVDKPKQFLTIGGKPIIIHTIEKFFMNGKIDKVIVLCPEQWISYTMDLIHKYLPEHADISVIKGGAIRNETIMNAIRFVEDEYGADDQTIIVTHDAVRPFVTHRIIEENIRAAEEGYACDTVIPAADTIVESRDGTTISLIPDRSFYYQGQTPQSFRMEEFRTLYESLSEEEKQTLTDAAKVFVLGGRQVRLVRGEPFNIKITYPYDLQLAKTLLREEEEC